MQDAYFDRYLILKKSQILHSTLPIQSMVVYDQQLEASVLAQSIPIELISPSFYDEGEEDAVNLNEQLSKDWHKLIDTIKPFTQVSDFNLRLIDLGGVPHIQRSLNEGLELNQLLAQLENQNRVIPLPQTLWVMGQIIDIILQIKEMGYFINQLEARHFWISYDAKVSLAPLYCNLYLDIQTISLDQPFPMKAMIFHLSKIFYQMITKVKITQDTRELIYMRLVQQISGLPQGLSILLAKGIAEADFEEEEASAIESLDAFKGLITEYVKAEGLEADQSLLLSFLQTSFRLALNHNDREMHRLKQLGKSMLITHTPPQEEDDFMEDEDKTELPNRSSLNMQTIIPGMRDISTADILEKLNAEPTLNIVPKTIQAVNPLQAKPQFEEKPQVLSIQAQANTTQPENPKLEQQQALPEASINSSMMDLIQATVLDAVAPVMLNSQDTLNPSLVQYNQEHSEADIQTVNVIPAVVSQLDHAEEQQQNGMQVAQEPFTLDAQHPEQASNNEPKNLSQQTPIMQTYQYASIISQDVEEQGMSTIREQLPAKNDGFDDLSKTVPLSNDMSFQIAEAQRELFAQEEARQEGTVQEISQKSELDAQVEAFLRNKKIKNLDVSHRATIDFIMDDGNDFNDIELSKVKSKSVPNQQPVTQEAIEQVGSKTPILRTAEFVSVKDEEAQYKQNAQQEAPIQSASLKAQEQTAATVKHEHQNQEPSIALAKNAIQTPFEAQSIAKQEPIHQSSKAKSVDSVASHALVNPYEDISIHQPKGSKRFIFSILLVLIVAMAYYVTQVSPLQKPKVEEVKPMSSQLHVPKAKPSGVVKYALSTFPAGARIFVDGHFIKNETPTQIELEKDHQHQIIFYLEGHLPVEVKALTGEDKKLDINLVPVKAPSIKLKLDIEPSMIANQVEILVNGVLSNAKINQIPLLPGYPQIVELRHPKYQSKTLYLHPRLEQDISQQVTLNEFNEFVRPKNEIFIESQDKNTIFIQYPAFDRKNDKPLGRNLVMLDYKEQGFEENQLLVFMGKREGSFEKEWIFKVKNGSYLFLFDTIKMTESYFSLDGSAQFSIYIDGKAMGKLPFISKPALSSGLHQFMIKNEKENEDIQFDMHLYPNGEYLWNLKKIGKKWGLDHYPGFNRRAAD